MDIELVDSLRLIIERCGGPTDGSVFVPLEDFCWHDHPNGQLSQLADMGYITKPFFCDDGARTTLTPKGRSFFARQPGGFSLTEDKLLEILSSLRDKMEIPADWFGLEPGACRSGVKQLQEQGLLADIVFVESWFDPNPTDMMLGRGYVTLEGLRYLEDSRKCGVDLGAEIVSACVKIADNTASYASFDEDGLNREIRNYLDSAISRFGYAISDQSQQGLGKGDKRPGELDIRISKDGIPVAIYEGLVHRGKAWLVEHINKAIDRYNQSGCKAVFIVEFSRNKGFGGFWDSATETLEEYEGVDVVEENTGLLGVRKLHGTFDWHGDQGELFYLGVNCYAKNEG